jgi:homoprotocatechuate degradation regulator HpaR
MNKGSAARLPPYKDSLAGTLLAAREAVMAPIRPGLRKSNLTEQQWRVLRVLAEAGPMDVQSIAGAALLHAPSVTRILKELRDRKLIKRQGDPEDGRRSIIAISELGLTLMEEVAVYTLRALDLYNKLIGKTRLKDLQSELVALIDALTPLDPEE